MMDETPAVVLDNVGKIFAHGRQAHKVVDTLPLSISAGEFAAVVGPRGCGKTTILKMIAGLTHRSSGRSLVGDREVSEPLLKIGIIFQTPSLMRRRTLLQNVLLPEDVRSRIVKMIVAG